MIYRRAVTDPTSPEALRLALAVVILVGLALAAATFGRLAARRQLAVAAVRAVVQLGVVSLIITAVLSHLVWSLIFAVVMFGVAVGTSSRRVGAPRAWPWAALAMASGVVPVLAVIFLSGAVPWNGPSLVPMAGIIIGGTMTAHSLLGRRLFGALRDEHGCYEAGLSIGLPRAAAISEVIERHRIEALVPGLDQTRTVGLVTLPGAFVGVLLGGGTPLQAGAAQLIVLVGLLAAQTICVVVGDQLIRTARLLPDDLRTTLVP
jgi:putative ABC transport system permease protein